MVRRPYIMGALACLLPLVDNLKHWIVSASAFFIRRGADLSEGGGTGEAVIYIKGLCYELIWLSKLLEFCLFVSLKRNLGILSIGIGVKVVF
jgi:hypothetical protein